MSRLYCPECSNYLGSLGGDSCICGWRDVPEPQPKSKWVALTDEDKEGFWTADQMSQEEWDELYKAVEAKLKEKNT